MSSLITPFLFGTVLGGIASGRVPVGNAAGQSLDAWLNHTSAVVGLLAVVATAHLAAVFLTSETALYSDDPLERYFRRRAVASAFAAGALAVVGFLVIREDAPFIYRGLTDDGLVFVLASTVLGLAALALLQRGARRRTRILAVAAVAAVMWAWGVAQYPYILPPDLTIRAAAGSVETLGWVVLGFVLAAIFVVPALVLLFVLE